MNNGGSTSGSRRQLDARTVTSADLHDRYFAGRRDGLSPVGGEDLVIATVGER